MSGFSPTPAQGKTFAGITGLTSVRVSAQGQDPTDSSNRLDASTLSLSAGDDRVYVDGLPDPGQGANDSGVSMTVQVEFLSASPPAIGDETSEGGVDLVCTETEVEYAVGELVKGRATYVTKPEEDEE
jgi:hypothetical protein